MCGRYIIDFEEKAPEMKKIIETLTRKVGFEKIIDIKTSGEVTPACIVPVLAHNKIIPMQWGFIQNDGKMLINARSETAGIKYLFKKSFNEMRCLIPASGYYEWHAGDTRKYRYAFRSDDEVMYMAAIYRYELNTKYPRFVILTRNAAPDIVHIHDRMPVILSGTHRREWLMGNDPSSIISMANIRIRYEAAY